MNAASHSRHWSLEETLIIIHVVSGKKKQFKETSKEEQ